MKTLTALSLAVLVASAPSEAPAAASLGMMQEIADVLNDAGGTPTLDALVQISSILAAHQWDGSTTAAERATSLLVAEEIAAILDACNGNPTLEDLVAISEVLARHGWEGVSAVAPTADPGAALSLELHLARALSAILAAADGSVTLDDMVTISRLLAVYEAAVDAASPLKYEVAMAPDDGRNAGPAMRATSASLSMQETSWGSVKSHYGD